MTPETVANLFDVAGADIKWFCYWYTVKTLRVRLASIDKRTRELAIRQAEDELDCGYTSRCAIQGGVNRAMQVNPKAVVDKFMKDIEL